MSPVNAYSSYLAMAQRYLPALLLALAAAHTAYAASLTVTTLKDSSKHRDTGETPEMPFVTGNNADVANRINEYIYLSAFHVAPPTDTAHSLKGMVFDGTPEETSVIRNDTHILSLSLRYEGCGAYCSAGVIQFAFDAKTGRHITMDDLFSPDSQEALAKRLAKLRIDAVNKEIVALKKERKKNPSEKPSEGSDESETQIALDEYEGCVGRLHDAGLQWDALEIGKEDITFIHEQCIGSHAIQALDDLGEFRNRLALRELKPYLTPYGQYLMLNGAPAPAPASPYNQVLHGKAGGRASITVLLDWPKNMSGPEGTYYYDKYRKPIGLDCMAKGDTLVMTETGDAGPTGPVITVKVQGNGITGQWRQGDKILDFTAAY